MRVIHHPASKFDVLEIVEYYERQADAKLAADFYSEVMAAIGKIASRPNSYPILQNLLRRVNLNRFPHHVLFEIIDDRTVAILVVKHDRRNPAYGLDRQV